MSWLARARKMVVRDPDEASAPGVHPTPFWSLRPQVRSRVRRRDHVELPAALVSREGVEGVARLELLVLARHDVGRAVPAADAVGPAAAVPVRAVRRARVPVGQGHRVRHFVRFVDSCGASDFRAPDGGGGVPAPGARLPHGRLQERHGARSAAPDQLGDRRRDAAAHAVPVVHRLSAAVGPAGVLGRDRRHEHRGGGPVSSVRTSASC